MQLPFTETQFLDNFGAFNAALWPVLAVLWVAVPRAHCATDERPTATGRPRNPADCALALGRSRVSRGLLFAHQSRGLAVRRALHGAGAGAGVARDVTVRA